MRLGVIAFEHPPALGGMERLAAMHIGHLARRHQLVVFTREDVGDARAPGVRYESGLTGSAASDVPRLAAEPVDGWLFFNGGLASYIPLLSKPAVAMVHGNDILRPWTPMLPQWEVFAGRLIRKLFGHGAYQAHEIRARQRRLSHGLRQSARIVAVSQFTRDTCEAMIGAMPGVIEIIHPGLEDEWFTRDLRRTRRPTSNAVHLLSVARLTSFNRRKNIDGVLQALAQIGERVEFTYTVIGEGDDRPRLMALADTLGLSDRVHFLGAASPDRLRQAYLEADLFVLVVQKAPDDVEGFGMVYTEAAATGLPSLATRSGGVADAVADGVSGILVDDAEPSTIAQAIVQFAEQRTNFETGQIRAFAEGFRMARVGPQLEGVVMNALLKTNPA